MKTRVTSGEGWSLSSDQPASASTPPMKHSTSPQPKIRLEKRSGKTVTVIAGLHTYGAERLEKIAHAIKTKCGTGGTVKSGVIEIQGDKLAQVKDWFAQNLKSGS